MHLAASAAGSVQESTGGFFTTAGGVVTLAVLCVLATGTASYLFRTVPKQMVMQVQVRDAILGNKSRHEPGLIEDMASLRTAFNEHLEARQIEMSAIHEDIAGIHADLAQIKEIVMPSQGGRFRFRAR